MTFEELKELIALFNASHLESMKVEFENTKLDLKKRSESCCDACHRDGDHADAGCRTDRTCKASNKSRK